MSLFARTGENMQTLRKAQLPWFLALGNRYRHVDEQYNCQGLGRESFQPFELESAKVEGLDEENAKALGVIANAPFVSVCAGDATILHFNGPSKPWDRKGGANSLCETSSARGLSGSQRFKLNRFTRCKNIWETYSSIPGPSESIYARVWLLLRSLLR